MRCCAGRGFENLSQAHFCGKCGSSLAAQPTGQSQHAKSKAKSAPKDTTRKRRSQTKMQATEEPRPVASEAERRQLTVMFCDLVGLTALSAQLDPEDYRAVVQQYQRICTEVIQRYEGYLAQYLGDGLLVYFGYPTAHEDDAARAVQTGLGIVEALQHLYPQLPQPLQVRIGIHTGLVVIGDIGAGSRMEQLALGETPNFAARIQGLAEPNMVLISATTQRLVEGQFEGQPFGSHPVKGIATPIAIYHIQSERQGTSLWSGKATLTPLVSRKQVEAMIDKVAAGQRLSAAVTEQIRIKTDGVPLFVEQLTKSVVETGGAQGSTSLQPLAIPATLYEARLELARSFGWAIQGPGANGAGLETLEIFQRREKK